VSSVRLASNINTLCVVKMQSFVMLQRVVYAAYSYHYVLKEYTGLISSQPVQHLFIILLLKATLFNDKFVDRIIESIVRVTFPPLL
jgi:hypothetical protein